MKYNETIYATAINAALEAGKAIMEVYGSDFQTEFKADGSPITLADRRANDIICSALQTTGIGIISEESPREAYSVRKNREYLWIVDPVDGTKEFTSRNDEFTVNIALIHHQTPVFGIVTAPAVNQAYIGWKNKGAFKIYNMHELYNNDAPLTIDSILSAATPVKTRTDEKNPVFVISRSHVTKETKDINSILMSKHKSPKTVSKGSSLKFCLLAEGSSQYYARADQINEWDTAAGHAVLLAAGGDLFTLPQMDKLHYNKEELVNPGFVAFADPAQSDLLKQYLSF